MDTTCIDLTQTLDSTIPTWDGCCGLETQNLSDYDQLFRVQSFRLLAGSGTHLDAPSHMIPQGASISDIPVSRLIGPLCVIDVSSQADENYELSVYEIVTYEQKFGLIPPGAWVIVYTGWSRRWNEPILYRNEDEQGRMHFPKVGIDAARKLVQRGIVGLGIDTLSPDGADMSFPVHQLLLSSKIAILENVASCEHVPSKGMSLVVLPMKVRGATEAPARAVVLANGFTGH